MDTWENKERSITLTNEQWSKLTCFILMSTNYREGERDAWRKLANERTEDGSPKFQHAASNAEYWQELNETLENIRTIIDQA